MWQFDTLPNGNVTNCHVTIWLHANVTRYQIITCQTNTLPNGDVAELPHHQMVMCHVWHVTNYFSNVLVFATSPNGDIGDVTNFNE